MSLEKVKETIFAYDKEVIDCEVLRAKNVDLTHSKIYFQGILLTGSTELPNNPFYFGELDKDNVIKQDKPSYYFSPSDESSGKGRLSIFYKNNELCLLNYSILEKSLNIKLECLSKQSLEYKDLISNTLKEQTLTQIDKKQSIAKLHALLENQNLECIHGGKVILKSSKGKSFKDNNIPIMLESDLLNSSIVACPNTIAGVSVPCTKVVNVKGSLSQKKVNNEYVILQELISACITDKGFPLKVSFTPTKFKFDHSFDPKEGLGSKSKESGLNLESPHLNIITPYRNLKEFYFSTNTYENAKDDFVVYKSNEEIKITFSPIKKGQDCENLESNIYLKELIENLQKDYSADLFSFRIFTLKIAYCVFEYIFIVPKIMPNFVLKRLKQNRQKEDISFGYGEFFNLEKNYARLSDERIDIQGKVFIAPSGMEKMKLKVK
ncbi:hypothetical protein [Campylobacter jejuni]|uniref:hypothetical protein n=1 Tax=Campylobacter jejuni TaxID=197 RepID=UPI002043A039|nr:hypothetical protein [Campylobacter jejuni]